MEGDFKPWEFYCDIVFHLRLSILENDISCEDVHLLSVIPNNASQDIRKTFNKRYYRALWEDDH